MVPSSLDLSKLDPNAFQHLVNALAIRVLGSGTTSFGPGPDGGRDGYFEGEAPYPSTAERWRGRWYIQSKYHSPHLSQDAQKWLLKQIHAELSAFGDPTQRRRWPDIWIVATNVNPSAVPESGTFDAALRLVGDAHAELKERFHIWGGDKVVELLLEHSDIASRYGHFITPGHVLTRLMNDVEDQRASAEAIVRHLVVGAIEEQQHTKLEQAGSEADKRPGIHEVFVDLPFFADAYSFSGTAATSLALATAQCHRHDSMSDGEWNEWRRHPSRASVWFLKGGPGQGKSTVGQLFCQIQRAALLLGADANYPVAPAVRILAEQIREFAVRGAIWPHHSRIPIYVELKVYAQWYGRRATEESKGVLSYVAAKIAREVEQPVHVGTLRRLLAAQTWFVVFDGLDEVPSDVKDALAKEVHTFLRHSLAASDVFALCTSRPQGYSGQFDALDGPTLTLQPLDEQQALNCAELLLRAGRPKPEADKACEVLTSALESPAVKELMTTPLQAHIMAIIVRNGQRPPERKWELYRQFYEVIRSREANRDPADKKLGSLLTRDKVLLKDVHNRLGFVLHAQAETSSGAQASLPRNEFELLVKQAVCAKKDREIDETVETIMTAATERLVLISTPDDGTLVRFQIRQLQEFFAAEFLCDGVSPDALRARLESIAGDAHWQEVMHFLMSALVNGNRRTELSVANSVLQGLDDGAGDMFDRTLSQRFARGALIVARLLEDGVLESDKSLRNLFRDRLRPLLTTRNGNVLSPLVGTQGPTSRLWLHEFCLRELEESLPVAVPGATSVLFSTLRDTDVSELRRFRACWDQMPAAEKATVLRANGVIHLRSTDRWRIEWLADLLVDERCTMVAGDALRDAALYDPGEGTGQVRARLRAELAGRTSAKLAALIDLYSYSDQRPDSDYVDFEWVSVAPVVELPPLSAELTSLARELADVSASGFIELVRLALIYVSDPSTEALRVLAGKVGASWRLVFSLPNVLRTRVSHLAQTYSPKALLVRLADVAFAPPKPMAARVVRHKREVDDELGGQYSEFDRLAQAYPDLAVELWARWHAQGSGNVPGDREMLATACRILCEQPQLLRDIKARYWPDLLDCSTAHGGLRENLVKTHKNSVLSFWVGSPRVREWRCLQLSLPDEANLLVPVCSEILGAFASTHRYGRGLDIDSDARQQIARASSRMTEQCSPKVEDLLNVAIAAVPAEVRAAAVLMGVLHQDGGIAVALDRDSVLIEACRAGSSAAIGLGLACEILGVEREPRVATLLSKLLDAMRACETTLTVDHRIMLSYECNSMIDRWRERSGAPVTKSGQQAKWLVVAD
jgi:hypothetical protein